MNDNPKWEIIQGDALQLLPNFAPGTFDAVITDPPYASGGRTQAEKNKSTAKKYSSMGDHAPPPFDGDSKDQRSWTRWAAEWLGDARKLCKPGAPVCMFIDWRQLPAASDALQDVYKRQPVEGLKKAWEHCAQEVDQETVRINQMVGKRGKPPKEKHDQER